MDVVPYWCSYRAKLYIFKLEKDLQVEFLKPEPCNDLSDGHDVGILLPHTGEHHQGQLDVECAQALKKRFQH
jgi:hypothetical protein